MILRTLVWIFGLVGIGIAGFGVWRGLFGDVVVFASGRMHAPSTFVVVGILFILIGIWLGIVALAENKMAD